MAYRIVKQARAWRPVEWPGISEDGESVTNRIELRFRILKVDAATAFIREVVDAQARETRPDVDAPQVYAELVAQIADEWRGVLAENEEPLRWDVPESWIDDKDEAGKRKPLVAPNLRTLMNEGGMFTHIFSAWRDALAAAPKVREGN